MAGIGLAMTKILFRELAILVLGWVGESVESSSTNGKLRATDEIGQLRCFYAVFRCYEDERK